MGLANTKGSGNFLLVPTALPQNSNFFLLHSALYRALLQLVPMVGSGPVAKLRTSQGASRKGNRKSPPVWRVVLDH
jgi:hypothetical protein